VPDPIVPVFKGRNDLRLSVFENWNSLFTGLSVGRQKDYNGYKQQDGKSEMCFHGYHLEDSDLKGINISKKR
jgi:hypothetical protein